MLRRNIAVKAYPERWQNSEVHFDLVICFEQRIYDIVVAGISPSPSPSPSPIPIPIPHAAAPDIAGRGPGQFRVCHVVNIDTVDNLTAAIQGGELALELVRQVIVL